MSEAILAKLSLASLVAKRTLGSPHGGPRYPSCSAQCAVRSDAK